MFAYPDQYSNVNVLDTEYWRITAVVLQWAWTTLVLTRTGGYVNIVNNIITFISPNEIKYRSLLIIISGSDFGIDHVLAHTFLFFIYFFVFCKTRTTFLSHSGQTRFHMDCNILYHLFAHNLIHFITWMWTYINYIVSYT